MADFGKDDAAFLTPQDADVIAEATDDERAPPRRCSRRLCAKTIRRNVRLTLLDMLQSKFTDEKNRIDAARILIEMVGRRD